MAEIPTIVQPSEAVEPQVEKTSRFKSFTVNHPRTAKVVGIVALTAGVLGVVTAVKNKKTADVHLHLESPTVDASIETSSETAA